MRFAILAGLFALVASCGAPATRPPVGTLQRLDASTPKLSEVSQASRRIAVDAGYLAAAVGVGNVRTSRAEAVIVKRDGARLMATTSRAAIILRTILSAGETAVVSRYVMLVLRVLAYQWQEAAPLMKLCDLVWADPLIRDQREQQRLTRLSLGSRWFAWQAVLAARASSHWKSAHRRFFRYHAVAIRTQVSEGYTWT